MWSTELDLVLPVLCSLLADKKKWFILTARITLTYRSLKRFEIIVINADTKADCCLLKLKSKYVTSGAPKGVGLAAPATQIVTPCIVLMCMEKMHVLLI